jgi:AcrR family transcriptional regulator
MVKKNTHKIKEPNNTPITRRDEIIQVAAKIFAAKGYHSTTLDEIASELLITKPALYYHIRSKEELLREIIKQIMEPLEEATKVELSNLSPKEKLEKIIEIMIIFGAERRETTTIAFQEGRILPKRTRDAIRRREKEVERIVQGILTEGVEKGFFEVDDIKMACFAILGAANWIYRWYHPDGYLSPKQIAQKFIYLLEHGYLRH